MHMFSESTSANTSTLRSNNENFAKFDTYYYQVHQQIDLIRKYKLSSDLNSKEKVSFIFKLTKQVLNFKIIIFSTGRSIG